MRKYPPGIPDLNLKTNSNNSPHVVILGAGASVAACPNGDRNGRKIPLISNLVDIVGLNAIFARYDVRCNCENFEEIYSNLANDKQHSALVKEIEDVIDRYFQYMHLPDEATIYDYLVLSLRSKDIIATFNWDPFLGQAFARNMNVIGFENMPKLAYLHGNVAIGICKKCLTCGWRYNKCLTCNNSFLPSRLLYPIHNKHYNDDKFLYGEWQKLQEYIQLSYLITIFGYSSPITDIEAKKLLLNAWERNETNSYALMNIIDKKSRKELIDTWKDFFSHDEYEKYFCTQKDFFSSQLAIHPRRTCDADAMARLQQSPWKENRFPKTVNLHELQQWVMQLVEEEKLGYLTGNPCKNTSDFNSSK